MLKDAILKILEQNKGVPVSGLAIGKELGVSRSAVWKGIHQLQEQGFAVSSIVILHPDHPWLLDFFPG